MLPLEIFIYFIYDLLVDNELTVECMIYKAQHFRIMLAWEGASCQALLVAWKEGYVAHSARSGLTISRVLPREGGTLEYYPPNCP